MGLTNARIEFLNHINGREVLCAIIQSGDEYSQSVSKFYLTTGWTKEEWDEFLSGLNFDYDSGYGGQELFGTIWYVDGTWSERGEYDGSEWWEHHVCPDIPTELNRLDKVREKKLNQIL